MTTIYKILFEVQVLHEFYLTNQDNTTIFEGTAAARQLFLNDRFIKNARSISSDLRYVVPPSMQSVFSQYRLKLLAGYSGFKIAIEVIPVILGGNIRAYKPVKELPGDLDIQVLLLRKDYMIDIYTNRRLQINLKRAGYFSNDDLPGAKTFPFLSNPVAAFDAAAVYEQGELSSFGVNDTRAFFVDNGGTDQFLPVTAGSYYNEADNLLTPPAIHYTFNTANIVTQASFTLKDSTNATVQTIQAGNGGNRLYSTSLQFDVTKLKTTAGNTIDNTLLYTLDVNADGGFSNSHTLLFIKEPAIDPKEVWGMVNIKPAPANAAFNIIDATGFLITRRNDANVVTVPPPIFEIWVKSRLSFWRYTNMDGGVLKTGTHPDLLFFNNGQLVSDSPRSHSYYPTLFKKADSSLHYLPNPKAYEPVRVEGNRLYTEIPVPASEMFPLGP
jgi:hypothetical protein